MNNSENIDNRWNPFYNDTYFNMPAVVPNVAPTKYSNYNAIEKQNSQNTRTRENFESGMYPNEPLTSEISERMLLYFIIFMLIITLAYMQMNFTRVMYKLAKKTIKTEPN